MSIQIITGYPKRLLDKCIEIIVKKHSEETQLLVMVPSNQTLMLEATIISAINNNKGLFDVDIVSRERLHERVFDVAGYPKETIVDNAGKKMFLKKSYRKIKDNLKTIKISGNENRNIDGYLVKIMSEITHYQKNKVQYEKNKKKLELQNGKENTIFLEKVRDLTMLMEEYEKEKKNKEIIDENDLAEEARIRYRESRILKDKDVIIYGYDRFDMDFVLEIISIAEESDNVIIIVETIPQTEPGNELYEQLNSDIERLKETFAAQGIKITESWIDDTRELTWKNELIVLEKGLRRDESIFYHEKPECITLSSYNEPIDEIKGIATKIKRLIMNGVMQEDITVMYSEICDYGKLINTVFPEYGISPYVSEIRQASYHPFYRFVISILDYIENREIESFLEIVKTGFLDITLQEASKLCNYCERVGIKGGELERTFNVKLYEEMSDEELEEINIIKNKALKPLTNLRHKVRNIQNVDDFNKELLRFMDQLQVYRKIETIRTLLEDKEEYIEAQDSMQIWNRFIGLLEQIHEILSEPEIKRYEIIDILKTGLKAEQLSAIPPVRGSVICGKVGEMEPNQTDYVFIAGCNTKKEENEGLFTKQEIDSSSALYGIELYGEPDDHTNIRRNEYEILICGKKQINISIVQKDEKGSIQTEGELIERIREIFPKLDTIEDHERVVTAPVYAMEEIAIRISEYLEGKTDFDENLLQTMKVLMENEKYRKEIDSLIEGTLEKQNTQILPETARKLFSTEDGRMMTSISRLEAYAECPYKNYITNGLMPRVDRDIDVNAIEMGKIYHEIAYEFIRRTTNIENFPEIQISEYEPIIDQILKDILPAWWNSNYSNSEKGRSIERKIHGVAIRTAENLLYQYRSGQFRPYAEEIEFGKGIIPCIIVELSDGTKLELRGRIDRIDIFKNDNCYLRVVDYKSGNRNVDPTKLYWGLQLQLPIYLLAVISHIEGMMPGGFFYCQIADPTIRIESRIKEEVEKKIAEQLALNGITLADISLVKAQGFMTEDNKKPKNIKEMLTYDEMKTVLEYARNKATELAEEMISGKIKPSPYISGNEPICKNCEYKSICGYDAELTKPRILERKTTNNIINM